MGLESDRGGVQRPWGNVTGRNYLHWSRCRGGIMLVHRVRINVGGGARDPRKPAFDSWIMTTRKRVRLAFVNRIGTGAMIHGPGSFFLILRDAKSSRCPTLDTSMLRCHVR